MSRKSIRVVLLAVLCAIMSLAFAAPSLAAKKPAKPKLISVKATGSNVITVKWKKAKRARKYQLYVSVDGGKFKKIYSGKRRSFRHRGIKAGHTYRYRVRAKNGKKKSVYSKIKTLTIRKTTKDFYEDLRDAIRISGSYDEDGNARICSSQTSDGLKYLYAVTYFEETSSFCFSMKIDSDYDTEYTAFYVDSSAIQSRQVQIEYRCTPKYQEEKPVEITSTLHMETYRAGTSLSWSGTQYAENEVRLSLKIAFALWQDLLDSTAALELDQLGFSGFRG